MILNQIKKVASKLAAPFIINNNKTPEIPKPYQAVFKTIKKDRKLAKTGSYEPIKHIAIAFMARNEPPAAAYCEMATFLLHSGYPDLAQIYHEHSLKLAMLASTYSLYLQTLMLNPACTEKRMYKAASRYDKLFLSHIPRYQHYDNELTTNRRLNIGYVCHFFHNSVSKSLLIPHLEAHNRERVKVFCYSDDVAADVPDSIKNVPEVWRDTKHLDDTALAELIKKDKIDVLLELNGHTIVNRYLTIARKPAPVQISFYNIATTTGISAIDYVLVGDEMCIEKVDSYYTESVHYFKGVCGIAKFPDDFPEVAPEPPCVKNKCITFGSFGGAQKVNAEVIKLWCKVLKKVPNSRLYMKAGVLTFEPYVKSYQLLFAAEGIDLDRITFEGFSEHYEMLKCYSRVDIALDTFPHAAGTTTMEATWMGVPVLSLYGDRHCMQHGKAILGSVGHLELVAYSENEFISKAAELAAQPERLIQYRKELREDFRNSPRADAYAFARTLENAYFELWEKYCQTAQL